MTDTIRIGVQGAQGSFSEIAGQHFAKSQHIADFEIVYLISSEGVLKGVNSGDVDYGVFAMENSQGGVVIESIIALSQYCCDIIEMFHVKIQQNLLTLPGTNADKITEIHSHQQALKQCRLYIADKFPHCALIEEDDTAEAARRLQEGTFPATTAVIANKACANIYDLELFEENIQDMENNLTLFLGVRAP